MDSQFITILILGFILGLKHALDPDHVVAVSTIVSDERSLLRSAAVGLSWGIGHTLTLFLVGSVVLFFRVTLPTGLTLLMEFAVGIMLVILGWQTIVLFRRKRIHVHTHQHDGTHHPHFHAHSQGTEGSEAQHRHAHPGPEWRSFQTGLLHDLRLRRKSVVIGMVHGLAGSAALMLLLLATVRSAVQGLAYILIFGVGSIGGMLMISSLIGLPVAFSAERFSWLNEKMGLAVGALSVGLGLVIMAQIGAALV